MDQTRVLPFSRVAKPKSSSPDLPVATDYKLYPVPLGTDYIISAPLLDLVFLHLVGDEVTDEQRRNLAQEMANLSGVLL